MLRQELIMQYDELNALGASCASEDSLKKMDPWNSTDVFCLGIPYELAWSSSLVVHPNGVQYVNDIIAHHANMYFRARMLYELARMACASEDDKRFDSLITEPSDTIL